MGEPAAMTDDMVETFRISARAQVSSLNAGLKEVAASPRSWPEKQSELCEIAHDLKSRGSSFGYPLITQIGLSLYRLLKDLETGDGSRMQIALAHAQALNTVLENNIQGSGGTGGKVLVQRLSDLTG